MVVIFITDKTKQRLFVHCSTATSSPLGTACHTRYVTQTNSIIYGQETTCLLSTDISRTS